MDIAHPHVRLFSCSPKNEVNPGRSLWYWLWLWLSTSHNTHTLTLWFLQTSLPSTVHACIFPYSKPSKLSTLFSLASTYSYGASDHIRASERLHPPSLRPYLHCQHRSFLQLNTANALPCPSSAQHPDHFAPLSPKRSIPHCSIERPRKSSVPLRS